MWGDPTRKILKWIVGNGLSRIQTHSFSQPSLTPITPYNSRNLLSSNREREKIARKCKICMEKYIKIENSQELLFWHENVRFLELRMWITISFIVIRIGIIGVQQNLEFSTWRVKWFNHTKRSWNSSFKKESWSVIYFKECFKFFHW